MDNQRQKQKDKSMKNRIAKIRFSRNLLAYYVASVLVITILVSGILFAAFALIPTQGSLDAQIEKFKIGSEPSINNFEVFNMNVYSDEMRILAGVTMNFPFYDGSLKAIDSEDRLIELDGPVSVSVDTKPVDGHTILYCNNAREEGETSFVISDFHCLNTRNSELSFSTMDSSENKVVIRGEFLHLKDKETAIYYCSLKVQSGTIIGFETPADLQYYNDLGDFFETPDGYHMNIRGLLATKECTIELAYKTERLQGGNASSWEEDEIEISVEGDNPNYSLSVINAETVVVSGTGTLNYYRNDINEERSIYSQTLKTVDGSCNIRYSQIDQQEKLVIEGEVKDLYISGKSRRHNFLDWIGNNIGVIPAGMLTILGGATTFTLKIADKFDMKDSENETVKYDRIIFE